MSTMIGIRSTIAPGTRQREAADEFLDRACATSRATWLALGDEELARTANPTLAHTVATAALDAAIAKQRLEVQAWYVRDAVLSSAQLVCGAAPDRRDVRRVQAARSAFERAALAHLARPWLSSREFELLVGNCDGNDNSR